MQIAQPTAARTLAVPSEDAILAALVDRVTNGFTPEQHELARQLGHDGYVDHHLHPEAIGDGLMEQQLSKYVSLEQSGGQLLANYGALGITPFLELRQAAILRSAFSQRQLFERVVELFTDHFSIYQLDDLCRLFKTVDDREVIRAHALGKFPDMLRASAESAAMSVYLDNYTNTVAGAQENYARELMELHTLGVDGGYTEQDVKDVARAFTGWSFDPVPGPGFGEYRFVGFLHDYGAKSILGTDLPPLQGEQDGLTVLSLLAEHPSTANRIATKLCRWFLGYAPPKKAIAGVAAVYTATGGDLREMVREALSRENLILAQPWSRPKLKRPHHFAASLLRAAGVHVNAGVVLLEGLRQMGQSPYDWPAPNGYPDSLGAWGGSLLPRWEFASTLLLGGYIGSLFTPAEFLTSIGNPTKAELAAAIDQRLTGGRSPGSEVELVQRYVDSAPFLTDFLVREALALAASMPRFQLY